MMFSYGEPHQHCVSLNKHWYEQIDLLLEGLRGSSVDFDCGGTLHQQSGRRSKNEVRKWIYKAVFV